MLVTFVPAWFSVQLLNSWWAPKPYFSDYLLPVYRFRTEFIPVSFDRTVTIRLFSFFLSLSLGYSPPTALYNVVRCLTVGEQWQYTIREPRKVRLEQSTNTFHAWSSCIGELRSNSLWLTNDHAVLFWTWQIMKTCYFTQQLKHLTITNFSVCNNKNSSLR